MAPVAPVSHGDAVVRLHEAESKLQMRNVELSAARDQIRTLEHRMARALAPEVGINVITRASELTRAQAGRDVSSEAKRHAVYARLIKDFPDVSRRELALAIEIALVKEG